MNPLNYTPAQLAKAFLAFFLAGAGALVTALPDGLTGQEIVTIVVTAVVAFAGVFGITNQPS